MQTLGRRAAELLDPAGEEKAEGREPSFEARFEACGAADILEEMEKQSNECARLLNRIRPVLPPEAGKSLEDTLNRLLPVLMFQASPPASQHVWLPSLFVATIRWSLREV